jgi:glycosyltransferase involved in cell wall biosynthesis
MISLSIIICSYNLAPFLPQAIDSALGVTWPAKEVIVVDDGSTDNSREIIDSYGGRLEKVFKSNGGQNSAANAGFARSSGDVVIFLDADDALLPTVANDIAAAWCPGISKLQYALQLADKGLRCTGKRWPIFTERHTPAWARKSVLKSGYYTFSPTSGNAWSRTFLLGVWPLPTDLDWFDYYLSILAPFYGDVVSISKPGAIRRLHGANATTFHLDYWFHDMKLTERILDAADAKLRADGRVVQLPRKSEAFRKSVLASKRLSGQSALAAMALYWLSLRHTDFTFRKTCSALCWSIAVGLSPQRLALWAIRQRGNR